MDLTVKWLAVLLLMRSGSDCDKEDATSAATALALPWSISVAPTPIESQSGWHPRRHVI